MEDFKSKRRYSNATQISSLPYEILAQLCFFLPPSDMVHFTATCKLLNQLSHDTYIWRKLFQKYYEEIELKDNNDRDWKVDFKNNYSDQKKRFIQKSNATPHKVTQLDFNTLRQPPKFIQVPLKKSFLV